MVKYTLEYLLETLQSYNAILIGSYDKLSWYTAILYRCSCGEECRKQFKIITSCSGGARCKKCVNIEKRNKTIKTNTEKYGVPVPAQSEIVKNKMMETNLVRYGFKNSVQNKDIQEKIKQTNLKKYGVNSTLRCEEVQEKIKQSHILKYGVDNPLKSKEIQEKVKQTHLEKYGVEYPQQSKEIHKKSMETCFKNFGVYHPQQSSEVYTKSIETNLKKYGVSKPSQTIDIQNKIQTNGKKYKEYTMPSGAIRKVQGYEPFALDELVKIYTEEQIITNRYEIPRIEYQKNGKKAYYFPDIYIPHENRIIEVKSTWTYKCSTDFIQQKADATKEKGYAYEIWVFDKHGAKTIY